MLNDAQKGYTEEYYASHLGNNDYIHNMAFIAFFQSVAKQIQTSLNPQSVLDVGCACGHLVASLREEGIDGFGVDASEYALENCRSGVKDYCAKSVLPEIVLPSSFPVRYDLVTCIEVLEHLEERFAGASIEALTRYSDCILFSSTPSDFNEQTHVNVRPRSYWANLFAERGYYPDPSFNANFLSPQAILFRKNHQGSAFAYLDVEYDRLLSERTVIPSPDRQALSITVNGLS